MNKNGAKVGEGVRFERIRRITGYLVGTLERFNNAKKAELMTYGNGTISVLDEIARCMEDF